MFDAIPVAVTGSTGNATGSTVFVGPFSALALQFVVEAIGATPTVTYKFQGSVDKTNWYDIGYVTDASDTISAATRVRTTVGADIEYISNPVARKYQYIRVVTSSNTNVTYRAEAYPIR